MKELLKEVVTKYVDLSKCEEVETKTEAGAEVIKYMNAGIKRAHYIKRAGQENIKVYASKQLKYEFAVSSANDDVVRKQFFYSGTKNVLEVNFNEDDVVDHARAKLHDKYNVEIVVSPESWLVRMPKKGMTIAYDHDDDPEVIITFTDQKGKKTELMAEVSPIGDGAIPIFISKNDSWDAYKNAKELNQRELWTNSIMLAANTFGGENVIERFIKIVSFYIRTINNEVKQDLVMNAINELRMEREERYE